MSEPVEGIVTAVEDTETKSGKTLHWVKVSVNGDTLSFKTWESDQANFARDLIDDPRMVAIDWEQEKPWTGNDGKERPGARKIKTITGPLKEAQGVNGDGPTKETWADKDRRVVRQNSWRHACSLASYAFMNRDPDTQFTSEEIVNKLKTIAERIERHVVRGTDLEEDVPFDDAKDIEF